MAKPRKQPARKQPARASIGGASNVAGVNLETSLAAHLAVHILAQSAIQAHPASPPVSMHLQSGRATDDASLVCADGMHIDVQVKRTIGLSTDPESPLGSALVQFIASHRTASASGEAQLLVLAYAHATGPAAALPALVGRFASSPPASRTDLGALPVDQAKCLDALEALAKAAYGATYAWSTLADLLQRIRCWYLPEGYQGPLPIDPHGLLRLHVVEHAADANRAADWLGKHTVALARAQAGTDRDGLRRGLAEAGIALEGLTDHRRDRRRLRDHGEVEIDRLLARGGIPWNGRDLRAPRLATRAAASQRAAASSFALVGDPGSGKSTLLAQIATDLRAAGHTVWFLPANTLPSTLAAIEGQLGLDVSLLDLFASPPLPGPTFLFIDGLDSLRDSEAIKAFRALIERATSSGGAIRVVASVRRFDYEHGTRWRHLLPERSYVGPLTEPELRETLAGAPPLLDVALLDLQRPRPLLTNPFNLRLLAQNAERRLPDQPVIPPRDLRALLKTYWDARVLRDYPDAPAGRATPDQREVALVTLATELHRQDANTLSSLDAHAAGIDLSTLEELALDGVVERTEGRAWRFVHDRLFEYALSLQLRLDHDQTLDQLHHTFLALRYREPVRLWLDALWNDAPARFWDAFVATVRPGVRGVARVAFADAVIRNATTVEHLLPLYHRAATDPVARTALRFVVEGLAADPAEGTPLAWLGLAEVAASSTDGAVLRDGARALHLLLTKRRQQLDEEALTRAATAARSLLAAAWRHADEASGAPGYALACVQETFGVDPSASAMVLRRVVDEPSLPGRTEGIRRMMHSIADLIAAPALVGALYEVVAADVAATEAVNNDASNRWLASARESNVDDAGPHPPRISSQWQDAVDELEEYAGAFLAAAPIDATRSLVRAISRFAPTGASTAQMAVRGVDFPVAEWFFQEPLIRDLDWNLARRLVDALGTTLSTDHALAESMTSVLVEEHAPVVVWAAIVRSVPRVPQLASHLPELFRHPHNLMHLAYSIADQWRTLAPLIEADVRVGLENLDDDDLAEITRTRISRAMADDGRRGSTAIEEADEVAAADSVGAVWMLKRRGMSDDDIGQPANQAVRSAQRDAETHLKILRELYQGHLPAVGPTAFAEASSALRRLIDVADRPDVSPGQADDAWGTAAELATWIAHHGDVGVADVLFRASVRPIRIDLRPSTDLQNQLGGEAMYNAVEGLISLSYGGDSAASTRLREMVGSEQPAIRYAIARGLPWLAKQQFFSELAVLAHDQHSSVVVWVARGIAAYVEDQRGPALQLVHDMLVRTWSSDAGLDTEAAVNALRGPALELLLWHVLWRDLETDPVIRSALEHVLANVADYEDPIRHTLHALHDCFDLDPEQDPAWLGVRDRAWKFLDEIVAATVGALHERHAGAAPLAAILDHASFWPYIVATGRRKSATPVPPNADDLRRARILWQLGASVLRRIGTAGRVGPIKHVLDALESVLRAAVSAADPLLPATEVLSLFLAIARAAVAAGYADDWRGIDLFDRVVRHVIAERADLLDPEEVLGTVAAITEAFLDAGWPQGYLLARDLDLGAG